MLIITVSSDLVVESCCDNARAVLGERGNCKIGKLFDVESSIELTSLMKTMNVGAASVSRLLNLRTNDGKLEPVAGLVDKVLCDGRPLLRITVLYDQRSDTWLPNLIRSEEMHRRFVQTSSEAMWCIEFSEPVDLTLGEHEIVRQVFENECHWLMCNEAMARLYSLPEGEDLNRQPVSLYFPRNPENEAFIRQIIASDFEVDNALSIDTRHDGKPFYVENDVHCTIRDGRLFRMWGAVRDVTGYRQAQNRLEREAQDVRSILNAIPDVILVINRERRLLAVNSSFERLFGWRQNHFLGRDLQAIMDLDGPLPGGRRWYGVDRQRWTAEIRASNGKAVVCDVQSSPVGDEAPDRFVLTLRRTHEPAEVEDEQGHTVIPLPVELSERSRE
ncbi:MAG TPA: PAS domain-containing protein [Noviherbaspirillum sp.]